MLPVYRPPSEAESLLVQVTVGCSHNRCAFCAMYRDRRFRPRPFAEVDAELARAAAHGPVADRVFLCDGDALTLSTRRLLEVLGAIRARLPWVRRVGVYGDTRGVGPKSVDELRGLRDAGLGIVYHGLESGDDEVLAAIDKGATRAECVDMAAKLRAAGIVHSVIVLLGIGGAARSETHARGTAAALGEMDPPFVGALTVTVLPGTPLGDAERDGRFVLPGKFELLGELRTIVAEAGVTACRFSANHASNYLPLRAELPRDRAALLELLDEVIARRDERLLKPEWLRGL